MNFLSPQAVVKSFQIPGSAHVADIGAGAGFFTMALARLLSDGGEMYAVEVSRDMVTRLEHELKNHHIKNTHVLWGDVEKMGGTKLGDASMDAVVMANTLFSVSDRDTCAREIARILKKGGQIFVIDWKDSFGHMGPHPDHVVTRAAAEKIFARHGFAVSREFPAGSHHYGVVFKK